MALTGLGLLYCHVNTASADSTCPVALDKLGNDWRSWLDSTEASLHNSMDSKGSEALFQALSVLPLSSRLRVSASRAIANYDNAVSRLGNEYHSAFSEAFLTTLFTLDTHTAERSLLLLQTANSVAQIKAINGMVTLASTVSADTSLSLMETFSLIRASTVLSLEDKDALFRLVGSWKANQEQLGAKEREYMILALSELRALLMTSNIGLSAFTSRLASATIQQSPIRVSSFFAHLAFIAQSKFSMSVIDSVVADISIVPTSAEGALSPSEESRLQALLLSSSSSLRREAWRIAARRFSLAAHFWPQEERARILAALEQLVGQSAETSLENLTRQILTLANTSPSITATIAGGPGNNNLLRLRPGAQLTCTASVADREEDPTPTDSVEIEWLRDTVAVSGGRSFTMSQEDVGKRVYCRVRLRANADGLGSPEVTNTSVSFATLANAVPSVALVVMEALDSNGLTTTQGFNNSTFRCSAVGFDADNDVISYSYKWSSDVQLNLGSGVLVGGKSVFKADSSSTLKPGEKLYCAVIATDGFASSLERKSYSVISNRQPTLATGSSANFVSLQMGGVGDAVYNDSSLKCSPSFRDADGETLRFEFLWYVPQGNIVLGSGNISADGLSSSVSLSRRVPIGSTVKCRATASDALSKVFSEAESALIDSRPPQVTSVLFVPETPRTDNDILCRAEAVDLDLQPATLSIANVSIVFSIENRPGVQITADRNSALPLEGTIRQNSSSLASNDKLRCAVSITNPQGKISNVGQISKFVNNSPPAMQSVTISPLSNATTNEDVFECHASAVDPENKPLSYEFKWFAGTSELLTGMSQGSATSSSRIQLSKQIRGGGLLTCRVRAKDELQASAFSQSDYVVANRSPEIQTSILAPDELQMGLTASCVVAAVDPDNDPVTALFSWTRNGSPLSGSARPSDTAILGSFMELSSERVAIGDNIGCEVTVTDGKLTSVTHSLVKAVVNRKPVISQVTIQPTFPAYNDGVLTCRAIASDADNNTVGLSYSWFRHTGAELTSAIATESGAASQLALSSLVLPPGEVITCAAIAYDGQDYSTPQSRQVTLDNRTPSLTALTLSGMSGAGDFYNSSVLRCDAVAEDADKDSLAFQFSWAYRDQDGILRGLGPGVGGNATNFSVFDINGRGLKVGNTIQCSAWASDASGAISRAKVVFRALANRPPVVSALVIDRLIQNNEIPRVGETPAQPIIYNDDSLICSAQVTEPDFDGDTLAMNFEWRVENRNISLGAGLLSSDKRSARFFYAGHDALNRLDFRPGDVISCRLTAVDRQGLTSATAYVAQTIRNRHPVITQVSMDNLTDGASGLNFNTSTYRCQAVWNDPDLDAIIPSYSWRVKGGPLLGSGVVDGQGTSSLYLSGQIAPENVLECRVAVSDGLVSVPVNETLVASVVMNNRPPKIEAHECQAKAPFGVPYSCTLQVSDLDEPEGATGSHWFFATSNDATPHSCAFLTDSLLASEIGASKEFFGTPRADANAPEAISGSCNLAVFAKDALGMRSTGITIVSIEVKNPGAYISAVSPSWALLDGSNPQNQSSSPKRLVIMGSGFQPGIMSVLVGASPCLQDPLVPSTGTQMTCVMPQQEVGGIYDVSVSSQVHFAGVLPGAVNYYQKPAISAVVRGNDLTNLFRVSGGDIVKVMGSQFVPGRTTIHFESTAESSSSWASFTCPSPIVNSGGTEVSCRFPALAATFVGSAVVRASVELPAAGSFLHSNPVAVGLVRPKPTITKLSAAALPKDGGQLLSIEGTNFEETDLVISFIGGNQASLGSCLPVAFSPTKVSCMTSVLSDTGNMTLNVANSSALYLLNPADRNATALVEIYTPRRVLDFALLRDSTCALVQNATAPQGEGDIFCFGRNNFSNSAPASAFGVQLQSTSQSERFRKLYAHASGSHLCAENSNGRFFCAGNNVQGQVGTGSRSALIGVLSPITVPATRNFASFFVGPQNTCGYDLVSQIVQCFGANGNRELFYDGAFSSLLLPTTTSLFQLSGPEVSRTDPKPSLKALALGDGVTCAFFGARSSYACAGNGNSGVIGSPGSIGDFPAGADFLLPDYIAGEQPPPVQSASIGKFLQCISQAGHDNLLCSGDISLLPSGSSLGIFSPVANNGVFAESVSVGSRHACFLSAATPRKPYCFGAFGNNRLGSLQTDTLLTPTQVIGLAHLPNAPFPDSAKIIAGESHSCVLSLSGKLHCFGDNSQGQLGAGLGTGLDSTAAALTLFVPR